MSAVHLSPIRCHHLLVLCPSVEHAI